MYDEGGRTLLSSSDGMDSFEITMRDWMWRPEGLGLKTGGVEILVYSAIFSVSGNGQGRWAASQDSLADTLGVSRSSVNRAVRSLLKRKLILRVGGARRGFGRPTHEFQVNVEAARSAIAAVRMRGSDRHFNDIRSKSVGCGENNVVEKSASKEVVSQTDTDPNVLMSHSDTEQNVSKCDKSLGDGDLCSKSPHVAKCDKKTPRPVPAKTGGCEHFYDPYYQITYSQTDCNLGKLSPTGGTRPQSVGDATDANESDAAFEELVASHPLPVDRRYLADARAKYDHALRSGIGPDMLLRAQRAYTAHHKRRLAETGEWRVMSLNKWLSYRDGWNSWISYEVRGAQEACAKADIKREAERKRSATHVLARVMLGKLGVWAAQNTKTGGITVVRDDCGEPVPSSTGRPTAIRAWEDMSLRAGMRTVLA